MAQPVERRLANRRGGATVQFALTVPVLFMFIFGSMEFARANLLRNMSENAALEGARAGSLPGATAQDCMDAAQTILNIVGIQNSTITVEPAEITPMTESVTVTVHVPLDDNCLPMSKYVLGAEMEQVVSLPREYVPTGSN